MKKYISIFLFVSLFYGGTILAQESANIQKIWLNKKGAWVSDSIQANRYAFVDPLSADQIKVDIYTLNGTQTESIHYSQYGNEPKKRIKDGLYIKFHPNGQIKEQRTFKHRIGEGRQFYENGQLELLEHFQGNGMRTGKLLQYYPDGKLKREETYKNGICTKGKLYAPDGSKLEHTPWEQRPKYPEGISAFLDEVMKQARKSKDYFRDEYRNSQIRIRFIVDKEGKIKSPEIVHRVDSRLESLILQAINKCNKRWIPAYKRGELAEVPVTIRINLN